MRIHRIVLRDFAGVTESEIAPAESGVTVILGPNEAGKSSVVTALDLVFEFKDSSKHQRVREVKPTHRDAAPFVEVEVSAGPYRFTLSKRWLKSPATQVSVSAPRDEQLTGDEAHDRVRQILAETLDEQLWTALRQQQGSSLDQPELAAVGTLRRALADVDDEVAIGDHDDLLAAVRAERDVYYTETGKERTPLSEARAELDETQRAAQEASDALAAIARTVDAHRDREYELQVARSGLNENRAERAELREQRRQAEGLVQAVRDASAAQHAARLERAGLAERLAERARLIDDHEQRAQATSEAAGHHAATQEALARADAVLAAAQEEVREAEKRSKAAGECHDVARRRREALRDAQEAADLQARLTTIGETTTELAEVEAALEANRLDAAALGRLVELHTASESLGNRARAEAPAILVERLGAPEVRVDGETSSRDRTEVRAVRDTVVEVPEAVRVTVSPDHESTRRAEAAEEAREALQAMLADHDVADLDAARARHGERGELDDRRRELRIRREHALAGDTAEALSARHDAAVARASQVPASSSDTDEDLDALSDAADDARLRLDEARARWDQARAARAEADSATVAARVRAESADRELGHARRLLDQARSSIGDDALRETVRRAEATSERAQETLAAAERARDARDVTVLDERLVHLDTLVESASARIVEVEGEVNRLVGELRAVGAEGWHDRLTEAEGRVEDARRALDRRLARASAAKLLDDTLTEHRRRAQQRYVAPFTQAVEQLGRIVFGEDLRIHIGEDLRIESRTLDGVTVPFASLSGGAREQLALIGRLATAQLVDAAEGAPVVIDDALGFTDPERRRRMAAVLSVAARDAQVLVLTCEPERYRDVAAERTVRL